MPMSPFFIRLGALAAISLCIAGCGGRSESYRYKLTVAVNTPDGIKRASSVVEVLFWDVSIPARGTMHKLRGEALYLDLGFGARPLIALLTSRHPSNNDKGIRWSPEAGPDTRLVLRLYGEAPSENFVDDLPRIARMRGPHNITPADLPDLVTFANINDPATVIQVDRSDLQATFGRGISWNEITLESTDEPITTGIVRKLPWLPTYYDKMLDGNRYHDKRTLANSLSTADFDESGDLKESK
jgi:hypothetical protein